MVRILHLDDNETDRLLVKRELGQVFPQLQVREIRDQKDLDAALREDKFDLSITDYQLGWSNGLTILHTLKSRYPDCPVIMFTASGNEEIAVEAMKAGLDDYVVKSPRHAIRLVTAVRGALEKVEARRKVAETERERLALLQREQQARAEAERLLREAQEADRRKDEFLAMLAHELRNPLAPITNAVHLLWEPTLPRQESERLHAMLQRQVKHLSRLVDDLLDVTRITQGKIELRRERLDLGRLVRDTVEDHRGLIEAGRLQSVLEVPGEPIWVRGDRTRLAQIVGNLLQNAVKFTDAKGRILVRLTEDEAAQEAVLFVEDTGIGIDSELLPRVFEMFTQADRSLERSRGGLGLGLALVKGLMTLHGGRVAAWSDGPGQGARFTCRLPLDRSPATSERPQAVGPSRKTQLRILVIEDSRDGAETLRLLLSLSGHEVQVAHTGETGVALARQFVPAVILCDLGLPGGMSGFDVARTLRQEPVTSPTQLIAVSGYGQPEDQANARAAGFDLHLTKPVDPAELQRLLASF